MNNNKSFWQLINEYKINIPIIQRDYAQGRIEEFEKRDKFLNSIFKYLITDSNLSLDFIYGKINDGIFYPIDGQQRLTTLFLLHWYVFTKEKKWDEAKRETLRRFAYNTRISSREFCERIVDEDITIPQIKEDKALIEEISDKHWFRANWKKDPTINSMFIMMQAIHNKYVEQISDLNISLYDKLLDKQLITFNTLDLGEKGFELVDELYIKMNSRGKQLTNFENFKANFIEFIDKTFKEDEIKHPIKGMVSLSGYFSYKIEKEWTDLFWLYKDDKNLIDNRFLNFFDFISQLCFFKDNSNAKADEYKGYRHFEQIFNKKENLLFLFYSLDNLYDITSNNKNLGIDNLNTFFNNVFAENSLFDTNTNNLFTLAIEDKLDAKQKILFYSILQFIQKHKIKNVTESLKNYIRIVRNLLQARRQRNETKYNTNVRINEFGSYWKLFLQIATNNPIDTIKIVDNSGSLISKESIENEKIKANIIKNDTSLRTVIYEIENYKYFNGLIHLLEPEKNKNKLKIYFNSIQEIFNNNEDSIIIRGLIASGFKGIYTKNCRMGMMKYFGNKDSWNAILTSEDQKVSQSVISLLKEYNQQTIDDTEKKLQNIINMWFEGNPNDKSWKYYFLKYKSFTSNNLNYYAWKNDYEIRILGSDSSNPLLAYHINPYVLTVCELINNKDICDVNQCYQQYTGNSPLILKNGIKCTCVEKGWQIEGIDNTQIKNLIGVFTIEQIDETYFLKEDSNKDRIITLIDFIKEIYK